MKKICTFAEPKGNSQKGWQPLRLNSCFEPQPYNHRSAVGFLLFCRRHYGWQTVLNFVLIGLLYPKSVNLYPWRSDLVPGDSDSLHHFLLNPEIFRRFSRKCFTCNIKTIRLSPTSFPPWSISGRAGAMRPSSARPGPGSPFSYQWLPPMAWRRICTPMQFSPRWWWTISLRRNYFLLKVSK